VLGSNDSSCYSPSNLYKALFFYYVGSDNHFTQCESVRIWWDPSTVQGTPSFDGIIPGGQSFTIPEPSITTSSTQGVGFSWTPSIKGGTTFILVAGDNRGMGSGGEVAFTIGLNSDQSCLSSSSPSSTAGTPAGAYSTSTAASSTSTSGSGSGSTSAASSGGRTRTRTVTLIGGIVGGAVGGLLLISILLYLFARNARARRFSNPQPIDILGDPLRPETGGLSPVRAPRSTMGDILSLYGQTATSDNGSTYNSTPWQTSGPSEFGSRYNPPSEVSSSSRREQAWDTSMIQHKDAGVILLPPAEERVVELPPRYDNIGAPNRLGPEIVAQMRGIHHPI